MISLMFYCLLGVTAEHAAGRTGDAEQDLGTGASLQWEGMAPLFHVPQQDIVPMGTMLGPPQLQGAPGQGRRGWCWKQRWLEVTVGHSLRHGVGRQHRTSPG